jgi:hypothetical protein
MLEDDSPVAIYDLEDWGYRDLDAAIGEYRVGGRKLDKSDLATAQREGQAIRRRIS